MIDVQSPEASVERSLGMVRPFSDFRGISHRGDLLVLLLAPEFPLLPEALADARSLLLELLLLPPLLWQAEL